ncbi:hypothetical protein [Paractinoplanes lichenicola]|uniref:Uncharacterized protein n=1 Tax=Paractinoplanes lichenicola TaxID=2802976 RepID=A0ABS1VW24_9ACTN|nr:hypothetical protein [Actinoplanes lichenicola]MBL7258655.1 hypothetical protein [Actinoplanes lichenicola]
MISPQGQHQTYLHGFADRVNNDLATARRPMPARQLFAGIVLFAALVLGCVGFGGAMQTASLYCHDVGKRTCLGLIVNDLTGQPMPARSGD